MMESYAHQNQTYDSSCLRISPLRKYANYLFFYFLLFALSGCAGGFVNEESADNNYDICMQDGGNFRSKLIHCNIALHSGLFSGNDLANIHFMKGVHFQNGNQHSKAISALNEALSINPDDYEAYYYRGVSLEYFGHLEEAQVDYKTVLDFNRNDEFHREAKKAYWEIDDQLRYEEEIQNRPMALYYRGLWCPRVQSDSIFYPANEIHIDTIVTNQDGYHFKKSFPSPSKVYKNIKRGSSRRANTLLWQGKPQPLTLQVMVWEYDDGGPLVESLTEIAVDFALTRGTKTMGKYAVRQGVNRAAAQGGRYAANQAMKKVDLTGQLSGHISSLPKALVGANNDLVGAIGITNLYPDAFTTSQENGFRYSMKTVHSRGGADCRVYLEFR